MTNYQTTKYINGPINVVRLQGEVNSIKKIIYIFFDIHAYYNKCNVKYSLNIDQYIIRETKTNISYDFFIEARLRQLMNSKNNDLIYENYLVLIIDMFKNIEFKNNKIQNYNKNLRLHYMDWRSEKSSRILDIGYDIMDYTNTFDCLSLVYTIENLIVVLSEFIESFDIVKIKTKEKFDNSFNSLLEEYKTPENRKYKEANLQDHVDNFVWKLMNSYKYKNIKIKINKIIDNELNDCKIYLEKIKDIKNKIEKFSHIEMYKIYEIEESLLLEFIDIGRELTEITNNIVVKASFLHFELHLIRRFLDKDYITNAISYTGADHSRRMIYLFIKHFNFKITHCYNDTKIKLDEIDNFVKISNYEKFKDIFIYPEYNKDDKQCVNMKNFPDNFL